MKRLGLVCFALELSCSGLERQTETGETVSASPGIDNPNAAADTPESAAVSPGSAPDRSTAVAACVESFPAAVPFDAGWPPSTSPTPAQPDMPPPVRTPDAVVAECVAQAGIGCGGPFLSKEAASCAARATAPEPVLAPTVGFRTPWLGFNTDTRRVEWSVTAGICCGETWLFHVDANSGVSAFVTYTDAPQFCSASCPATATRMTDTSTPAESP